MYKSPMTSHVPVSLNHQLLYPRPTPTTISMYETTTTPPLLSRFRRLASENGFIRSSCCRSIRLQPQRRFFKPDHASSLSFKFRRYGSDEPSSSRETSNGFSNRDAVISEDLKRLKGTLVVSYWKLNRVAAGDSLKKIIGCYAQIECSIC